MTVVTDLDGGTGIVRWSAVVEDGGIDIRVVLRDAGGGVVAEGQGDEGELRVADAELWAPGRGYLYDLQVDVIDGDDLVDRYHQTVGIRTVRVDGTRFLINGEPFYFRGFGMHEDLNVRGRGHDDVSMVHDFELLAWLGANSFRTSHYPYAEEVLDHADRLGIVVIDETAAVGLNLGVAGGIFGDVARTTFTEDTVGSVDPGGPPAGDRGARGPRQEPPRASSSGASPTSPSPTPRSRAPTSNRSSPPPGRPTRPGPWGSST